MLTKHQIVAEAIASAAENQKWYQKYANTVVAFLASLGAVLAALAGVWATTGQFPTLTAVAAGAAPFITALAVRLTKNGVSNSTRDKVERAVPEPATPVATIHEVETQVRDAVARVQEQAGNIADYYRERNH